MAPADFIREVATSLGTTGVKSLSVYCGQAALPDEDSKQVLCLDGLTLGDAISRQRTDAGYTNHLSFDTPTLLDTIREDILASIPESLSEGAYPLEVSLTNGSWAHHDYNEGEILATGGCNLQFVNRLGYPLDLEEYLAAFMSLESVQSFVRHLEERSSHCWLALIDLA